MARQIFQHSRSRLYNHSVDTLNAVSYAAARRPFSYWTGQPQPPKQSVHRSNPPNNLCASIGLAQLDRLDESRRRQCEIWNLFEVQYAASRSWFGQARS